MNKIIDKINYLNKDCKNNWEIRFHGNYVDINYPDSPVTPDYEDYKSLDIALDEVIKDLKTVNKTKKTIPIHDYSKKVKSFAFNRVADHQVLGLTNSLEGLWLKIPDTAASNGFSSQKPFDAWKCPKDNTHKLRFI